MVLRARLYAVLLALSLVLTPLLAPAVSAAEPNEQMVPVSTLPPELAGITSAGAWLADQFVDGDYLLGFDGATPDPANTIDGAIALFAAGGHQAAADQATAWVADQAASYVTDPVSAARVAILADVAAQDPTDFGGVNLVDALGGELGDIETNPYGLALISIALTRLDLEVPANVTTALLATQEADGAFGYPGYGIDPDATAIATQALLNLTAAEAAEPATRAVDWLSANQCTESSELCPETGAYWGSYSPANTAGLAIGALTDADQDTADQLAWLVDFQNPDGGFPAAIGVPDSDPYATAQAILGLRQASLVNVVASEGAPVPAEQSSPAGSEPTAEDGNGIGLPVIIGVAVAAGVLGGALAFLRRRRQA